MPPPHSGDATPTTSSDITGSRALPSATTTPSTNMGFLCNTIPTFSGERNGPTAAHFFMVLEQLAALNGWTDTHKIGVAKLKMAGPAADFAWHDGQATQCTSFEQFKNVVVERFNIEPQDVKLTKFLDAHQRPEEDAQQFATRLQALGYATLEPSEGSSDQEREQQDRMARAILEKQSLTIYLRGLRNPVRRHVLSRDPSTLAQAISAARREEAYELSGHSGSSDAYPVRRITHPGHDTQQSPTTKSPSVPDDVLASILAKIQELEVRSVPPSPSRPLPPPQRSADTQAILDRLEALEATLARREQRQWQTPRAGPPRTESVECWTCGRRGHYAAD